MLTLDTDHLTVICPAIWLTFGAFNVPLDSPRPMLPGLRIETHSEGPLQSFSPALIETSMTDEYNEQTA
jgi:hypothetical protein